MLSTSIERVFVFDENNWIIGAGSMNPDRKSA